MSVEYYIGAALVAFLFYFFVIRSSSSSSSAPVDPIAEMKKQSWRGVATIDPELAKKHGIAPGETREWSLEEVAKHNKAIDLMMIIRNKVYDVTSYVEEHPGGMDAICRHPGMDNTEGFSGIQHPAKVWDMIHDYYVGDVVKHQQVVYTFKELSKM